MFIEMLSDDSSDEILIDQAVSFCQNNYLNTIFDSEDASDAIFELKISSGGTESLDFVRMLSEMYQTYFKNKDFIIKQIDIHKEYPGIKNIIWHVSGENAFGYLKLEEGIHRLIRISPFDSAKKRHTTFAICAVTPYREKIDFVLDSKDLEINTYRSSGAGGQSVNTTDSAVRVKHIPTGIVVTCQNERSQIKNKEIAIKIIKQKIVRKMELDSKPDDKKFGSWGTQIKTYTLHPYTMYKDHRFNIETGNVHKILDGNLDDIILESLIKFQSTKGNIK
jgi:peptide chain release factor 2